MSRSRRPLPRELVVPRSRRASPSDRAKVTGRYTLRCPDGVEMECVRVRHLAMNAVEHYELSEFNRLFKPQREAQ